VPPEGAWADGINSAGEIVGNYQDDFLVWHGFERMPDGTITEFDVPGYQNSKLFDISPTTPTYVTGITWNSDGVMYGFVAK
jgi:hypothetical protein